jgi:hypothetical protein
MFKLSSFGEEMRVLQIGVIGPGTVESEETAKLAYDVGAEIAKEGAILVCGGLGGVMEEAAKGAKGKGGLTIGILPGFSQNDANKYIDIRIVTGLSEARNVIVVRSCNAIIAIEGSYGTLSEIAFALRFGIPIIGLNTWFLEREGHPNPPIIRVQTPKEAVKKSIEMGRLNADRSSHPYGNRFSL